MDICMDYQCFKNCNNEAKRRLQMCAFQIIDKNIFLNMKEEITKSFNNLIKNDNEQQLILELNQSFVDSHDTRKVEEYILEESVGARIGCLSEGDNKDII
jgi:hypothetical protein